MKRKTNLFYTAGEDSKFLTFSNYTEALTGNFLSTNIKVLPSKFLCLNIPNITDVDNTGKRKTKEDFIKDVLVAHYENKLAFLRDAQSSGKVTTELNELAILLYTLYKNGFLQLKTSENKSYFEIPHVGNITEQDFKGTFTDIICVFDSANVNKTKYFVNNPEVCIDTTEDSTLYGWYNGETYTGPSDYNDVSIITDTDNGGYYVDNDILEISTEHARTTISFDVVIPLFNVYNTDTHESIKENCPMGIWFADKVISLEYDNYYGQMWSLAIGSQFKPLPTMDRNISDVTNDSNKIAYATFAQILSRQNALLSTFESLSTQLVNMQTQINDLKTQVNNLKQNKK